MTGKFLIKSRHGTVFYFRRRVPEAARHVIQLKVYVQSLRTSDRRLAIIRGRALAAHTDLIFQRITMAMRPDDTDGFDTYYTLKIDFYDNGKPSAVHVQAEPSEEQAVNSAITTTIASIGERSERIVSMSARKSFTAAIAEYFSKSQTKPQTKATYRSKLDHAQKFFGETTDVLKIDQGNFVSYCDHVLTSIPNVTTQGHYITTTATFLNWHRVRSAGLPALTTKTLISKRNSPESDDRDAYSLEQLGLVFENAKQYYRSNPCKFWASVATAFLGCRIEELSQIHLKSDLVHDEEADIWYLVFDGRPDPDGITRKSMKKPSNWRRVPIHESLIKHGFIDFLKAQQQSGFQRPFEKEWRPREVTSDLGQIIKWSHYISRWGGRELKAIAKERGFDAERIGYFHSMRHTFKSVLGDAGVSSEISEALAGRRYASSDAERYEKLKQNHIRLTAEGIKPGLNAITVLLDKAMGD